MTRGTPLALALALLYPTVARAQEAPAPPPRISLETRDTPLRGALRLLQAQSGLVYRLESSVPNVPVSIALRDVPPEDLLRTVVRQAAASVPGLRVLRQGDTYQIRVTHARIGDVQVPSPPEPLAAPTLAKPFLRKVSVGFRNEGLHQALARVFDLAGVPYSIEPAVPNVPVTVDVRAGTLWQVLREVLSAAEELSPLELGQIGEVYLVGLRAAPLAAAGRAAATTGPERITLRLDGVPLRLAADALFQGTGYRYTLTPDHGEKLITLNLQNAPLDVALSRLAHEASRLGVRLTWTRD